MLLVLLVVLIVLMIGGAPQWGLHNYGYYPTSAFGIMLIVLLILLLFGRL